MIKILVMVSMLATVNGCGGCVLTVGVRPVEKVKMLSDTYVLGRKVASGRLFPKKRKERSPDQLISNRPEMQAWKEKRARMLEEYRKQQQMKEAIR